MRVLFWNINGIVRDEAQCKLQELVRVHKPDIIGISEPRVSFSSRSMRRFKIEGFHNSIIHNSTDSSVGNLWVMWSLNLSEPAVLNMSRQAIFISVDGVYISLVHASSVQTTRTNLWQQLNMGSQQVPWLVLGDFNCVLRNEEKKGGATPRISVVNEFSDWIDDNSIFEAEALGCKFTWCNRQSGAHRIVRKLDHGVINEYWMERFENWRREALPREVSDHSPLIGYPFVNTRPRRAPFQVQKMWFLHHDFMRMVRDSWNAPLVGSPAFIFPQKLKRLKVEMKLWNQLVFGNVHVRLKQAQLRLEEAIRVMDDDPSDVHKKNVMKDAQGHDCGLLSGKIQWGNSVLVDSLFDYEHESISMEESIFMDRLPTGDEIREAVFDSGADSAPGPDGLLLLLTKERGANTLRNFRSIGLSNFFFKIFTKILATRLGSVLGNIVSEEQVAFMKGRNIHENISLASEMVNELQIKRKEGNVVLNLDIMQAFDTTGRFFSIDRGLRQGDPLSPLIFVLIEDVLSRNITKLFHEKKMTTHVTRKGISPTHLFFADDIVIFCKGNMKSLENLVNLLGSYQRDSGQTVSREKRKIYYGGGSLNRRTTIAEFLGMPIATFPDRYLRVKVMPWAVKYHHISNEVEKIKNQLAGWNGRMLSFQDRVVLVKSVIASYSIHNMVVYKWPRKFVHQCEVVIRNFLWSGDSQVSRRFVVAYDKICAPYNEGGLGITQMVVMNKAMLMKLCWNICNSKKAWARYLRAKFFGHNGKLVGYIKSSIFPGFKWVHGEVQFNSKRLIGDGRSTSLYFDACECIHDGAWVFNDNVPENLLVAGVDLKNLPMPMGGDDYSVWNPDYKGRFSVSSAKDLIRRRYPSLEGSNLLWRQSVHPALAARNWKLLRGSCATLDKVKSRFKFQVVNKCCLCNQQEETLEHILWSCSSAVRAWDWISGVFVISPQQNIVTCYKAAKSRSRMVKDLWLLAILVIRSELWMTRNGFVSGNQRVCWLYFQKKIFNQIQDYSTRLKGCMFNIQADLQVLSFFRVRHRKVKHDVPKECYWEPPRNDELMLCCDGAARGNPVRAGAGVVVRDANAVVVGAMSVGFGVQTNYLAEVFCVIVVLEWASKFGVGKICIRTDSMSAVLVYSGDINGIPWFLRPRWVAVKSRYNSIRFVHTYREANFAANYMAKRGCLLEEGEGLSYDNKPDFILSIELPNVTYFGFNLVVSFLGFSASFITTSLVNLVIH
ncbi:uncharacterized protein LOC113295603 [Papaver somniferum]|uniref:uncharacterized protein LOC113295603 n=1 Tax=Papaver somniferum TaxID=3469 RepID=UPI000E6FEB51|nr:uncharacterized protein LOC113295603 [Papaver somniferum]